MYTSDIFHECLQNIYSSAIVRKASICSFQSRLFDPYPVRTMYEWAIETCLFEDYLSPGEQTDKCNFYGWLVFNKRIVFELGEYAKINTNFMKLPENIIEKVPLLSDVNPRKLLRERFRIEILNEIRKLVNPPPPITGTLTDEELKSRNSYEKTFNELNPRHGLCDNINTILDEITVDIETTSTAEFGKEFNTVDEDIPMVVSMLTQMAFSGPVSGVKTPFIQEIAIELMKKSDIIGHEFAVRNNSFTQLKIKADAIILSNSLKQKRINAHMNTGMYLNKRYKHFRRVVEQWFLADDTNHAFDNIRFNAEDYIWKSHELGLIDLICSSHFTKPGDADKMKKCLDIPIIPHFISLNSKGRSAVVDRYQYRLHEPFSPVILPPVQLIDEQTYRNRMYTLVHSARPIASETNLTEIPKYYNFLKQYVSVHSGDVTSFEEIETIVPPVPPQTEPTIVKTRKPVTRLQYGNRITSELLSELADIYREIVTTYNSEYSKYQTNLTNLKNTEKWKRISAYCKWLEDDYMNM